MAGMNKLFFIIGIRRSGTSILRTMLSQHPGIAGIEFEPHDLWAAIDLNHFIRLMQKPETRKWVKITIHPYTIDWGKWYGAKFALNPGVKALEWVWLYKTFPEAKFIFIIRNTNSTWNSYSHEDLDSVRGIIDQQAYIILSENLKRNFFKFEKHNPGKTCVINFEILLRNPDQELEKCWQLLGLENKTGFANQIKKPRF